MLCVFNEIEMWRGVDSSPDDAEKWLRYFYVTTALLGFSVFEKCGSAYGISIQRSSRLGVFSTRPPDWIVDHS